MSTIIFFDQVVSLSLNASQLHARAYCLHNLLANEATHLVGAPIEHNACHNALLSRCNFLCCTRNEIFNLNHQTSRRVGSTWLLLRCLDLAWHSLEVGNIFCQRLGEEYNHVPVGLNFTYRIPSNDYGEDICSCGLSSQAPP